MTNTTYGVIGSLVACSDDNDTMQRKSDVMTYFGLTACSAVYYQVPHCRFLIQSCVDVYYQQHTGSISLELLGRSPGMKFDFNAKKSKTQMFNLSHDSLWKWTLDHN
jgi:hypothetical protein